MAKKVLIVDDELNIVKALDYLLHQRGFEARVAFNGEEALRQVEEFQPDLVLLDVMLPQKSGYDVCRRIRERREWTGIKIVMLSAKGHDAEVHKGLALGANRYITKPFSNAELMAIIEQLLGEKGASGAA